MSTIMQGHSFGASKIAQSADSQRITDRHSTDATQIVGFNKLRYPTDNAQS